MSSAFAFAQNEGEPEDDLASRWLDTYLDLERSASLIRCYAPGMIPGLLQTTEYTKEFLAMADPDHSGGPHPCLAELEQRKQILARPNPPRLWMVLEQAALRRQLGSHQAWREQLDHLARVAARPGFSVQIMPDHAAGPIISTIPFTVFRFAATHRGDIVHVPHATGAAFLEGRRDIDAYHAIWNRLCINALGPERTSDIVAAAAAGATL